MAKKVKTSYTMSEEADVLLAKVADKDDRSKSAMLEKLIKDAAKAMGIKAAQDND